jgi:autotransporter-associated beta strand protein
MVTARRSKIVCLTIAAIVACDTVRAATDVFGCGTSMFAIEFLSIGNPGNPNDPMSGVYGDYGRNVGGVPYSFGIGKYEVSRDAVEKVNAVGGLQLTLETAGAGWTGEVRSSQPATGMDWYGALRFVNYLNTSQGYPAAYKFSVGPGEPGYTVSAGISSWLPSDGGYDLRNPLRNKNAKYVLPSADEWHKAAYYDPKKGGRGGFWRYPTASDVEPVSVASGTLLNTAVYGRSNQSATNGPADVNNAGGLSAYGTMAQGGNVWEWQETIEGFSNQIADEAASELVKKAWRGGAFDQYNPAWHLDAGRQDFTSFNRFNTGFRVATTPYSAEIDVRQGWQFQSQAGYAVLAGDGTFFKSGPGELVLDQPNTLKGNTFVAGGTLTLSHANALVGSSVTAGAETTIALGNRVAATVRAVFLSPTARLDVARGSMTVEGGLNAGQAKAQLLRARGDGSWSGTSGITSSAAAASGGSRTVGWLDNGNGSMTFAFAAPGDSNLDWTVDILDASNFLSFGKFDAGLAATWIEGDYNYDATVDILDAADFFATSLYDAGSYNAPAGSIAAVPEPSMLGLVGVGASVVGLMGMRRKRAG